MVVSNINSNYGLESKLKQTKNISSKACSFNDALNNAINNKIASLDDIFTAASERYGVPINLLKAIAKAESNFNVNAVSSAGAQGIMQLMPSTASSLGVTNAFDAEQNIMGGAKYISQMLERFNNNTELALAAYNAGPGNVLKYDGVPPFKETQNYVAKVMGYMEENIEVGAVVKPLDTRTLTASDLLMQSMGLMVSLNNKNFNSMGYEMLISMYKYQVQAKLLANTNSEDII
ncbi:MAG: lytic transglycosylase domain-containing protein [Clostridia bacterium]|jgi:SLT domain-containing protein|nr:lytic transglycosylase domain-containing protein [Clostridia bacterium]